MLQKKQLARRGRVVSSRLNFLERELTELHFENVANPAGFLANVCLPRRMADPNVQSVGGVMYVLGIILRHDPHVHPRDFRTARSVQSHFAGWTYHCSVSACFLTNMHNTNRKTQPAAQPVADHPVEGNLSSLD